MEKNEQYAALEQKLFKVQVCLWEQVHWCTLSDLHKHFAAYMIKCKLYYLYLVHIPSKICSWDETAHLDWSVAVTILNIRYFISAIFCQKSQIVACHIRVFYVICLCFILMCAFHGSNEFLCYSWLSSWTALPSMVSAKQKKGIHEFITSSCVITLFNSISGSGKVAITLQEWFQCAKLKSEIRISPGRWVLKVLWRISLKLNNLLVLCTCTPRKKLMRLGVQN